MLYSSRNGTLFYYDRVLYTWQIAEPTMLFLLGFESITSYVNSLSDSIIIANSVYIEDQDDLVEFKYFNIYDKIHSYLSQLSSIEDYEYYLKFNCNGLKLLMNELTGTGSDRTIPIIFKNDINNKSIDLNDTVSKEFLDETATLYDKQAQKIRDIFANADYTSGHLMDLSNITDEFILDYMKTKNLSLNSYYSECSKIGQIYKLLDYSAMYSYSLGVLYGCRCLGFDPKLIWRIGPEFWYNGEFTNLVSTAWHTFRFHHTHYIQSLNESSDASASNKYKGITPNRLWNIGSERDIDLLDELPLKSSEINCYALHVDKTFSVEDWSNGLTTLVNETTIADPIIYSPHSNTTIYVKSIYASHHELRFDYKCFALTTFGDALPINGNYNFELHIVDSLDTDNAQNVIFNRDSNSKELFIFSTNDDDSLLYNYLERLFNNDAVQISVTVRVNDYTSDELNLILWSDLEPVGEYLSLSNLNNASWLPVSHKISSDDPKVGIVAKDDIPIIRYLADNPVVIRKAYQYADSISLDYLAEDDTSTLSHQIRESKYLSPSDDETYFIVTGGLGWSYFNEDFYKSSNITYPYKLSAIPYSDLDESNKSTILPSSISGDEYKPINYARYKIDNSIVTYYRCYVSDSNHNSISDSEDKFMYGIFNGNVNIIKDELNVLHYDYSTLINYRDSEDNKYNPRSAAGFFKSIISEDLFNSCYEDISLFEGFNLSNWYNIDVPVSIFINEDETMMYDGVTEGGVPIDNYGYTESKALAIQAFEYSLDYRDSSTDLVIPKPYDLRFYKNKYWSSHWKSWLTIDNIYNNIFKVAGTVTPIYKGQNLIKYTSDIYLSISNDTTSKYIFNNSSIPDVDLGFILIKPNNWNQLEDTLWKYGYTTHVCSYILYDDNGHYLTDNETSSGVPLVWYDKESEMYWNGLANINRWQSAKPILNSNLIYITSVDQYSQAIDDVDHLLINIDGFNYITYDEFYSDNTRGVIRYKLQVFNESKTEGIIDCLVDDKNDSDHPENTIYCIPGVTQEWVSRDRLLPEFGYRFVDGMTTLYSGIDKVNAVTDNDFSD